MSLMPGQKQLQTPDFSRMTPYQTWAIPTLELDSPLETIPLSPNLELESESEPEPTVTAHPFLFNLLHSV